MGVPALQFPSNHRLGLQFIYLLYIEARVIALWGRVSGVNFFFLEKFPKNIFCRTILLKIEVDPRNHPKFHMHLFISHKKNLCCNFWGFFVFPGKGVPLDEAAPSRAVTGIPSISGNKKIGIFFARRIFCEK